MKKILLAVLISLAGMTHAEAHGYYRGGYYQNNWVAPAIIGGVIGYGLARPYYAQPVYVQPPVYIQQQPVIVQSVPPAGYHWQMMIDPNTNAQQMVLVPN